MYKKRALKDEVPSIEFASEEALREIRRFIENYLVKDSEYKRLSSM